jgi:hypothetical protein
MMCYICDMSRQVLQFWSLDDRPTLYRSQVGPCCWGSSALGALCFALALGIGNPLRQIRLLPFGRVGFRLRGKFTAAAIGKD